MRQGPVRIHGHLGELVQGRLGPCGPVAVISLRSPQMSVTARGVAGSFMLHQPDGVVLRGGTVRRLFTLLGVRPWGRWQMRVQMPVGEGAGASTAAILALARSVAPWCPAPELMRICLASEGASDPLLFPAPERVLWASREGRILAQLPPLPPLRVVGGFYGPRRPTNPRDTLFPDISDITEAWPRACADVRALAGLVSLSSQRTMALRGGDFAALRAVQERCGALGVAIAHTGSGAALLFPPECDPAPALVILRGLGWRYVHSYVL